MTDHRRTPHPINLNQHFQYRHTGNGISNTIWEIRSTHSHTIKFWSGIVWSMVSNAF